MLLFKVETINLVLVLPPGATTVNAWFFVFFSFFFLCHSFLRFALFFCFVFVFVFLFFFFCFGFSLHVRFTLYRGLVKCDYEIRFNHTNVVNNRYLRRRKVTNRARFCRATRVELQRHSVKLFSRTPKSTDRRHPSPTLDKVFAPV